MTSIAAHQLGGFDWPPCGDSYYNEDVNAICPGSTLTEMGREIRAQRSETLGVPMEELLSRSASNIPMKGEAGWAPTNRKTSRPWPFSCQDPAPATSPARPSTSTAAW